MKARSPLAICTITTPGQVLLLVQSTPMQRNMLSNSESTDISTQLFIKLIYDNCTCCSLFTWPYSLLLIDLLIVIVLLMTHEILFTELWLTPLTTLIDTLDCPTSLYISYPTPLVICCSSLYSTPTIFTTSWNKYSVLVWLCICYRVFRGYPVHFPMLGSRRLVVVDFGVRARTCYLDLVSCAVWPGVW